jgi:3-oxoacyl-[acyl-carrier protein] reductase
MRKPLFSDQSAVVTGAGEGIGFEIARLLALSGAFVVLNDVDAVRARSAAAAIERQGGQCVGVGGDVGDIEVARGLIDEAVRTVGRITIAVANAGQTVWKHFLDFKPEDFRRVVDVNLGGSFFLAQAAGRHMRDQGTGGRILFMSSVTGHQAVPFLSAYSMSKAGLEMLARNLVVELGPYKITVNCIAPGATVTPRNLADDPDYEAHWAELSPTRRAAYPSDIARAALFLLAPSADQITGQTLVIDGGWSVVSPIPRLEFVEQASGG